MAGRPSEERSSPTASSRRRFLHAATAAGVLGFAGCIQQTEDGDGDTPGGGDDTPGSGDDSTQTDGTAAGVDVDSVTFGILSPVSGPFSPLGKAQRQAAKLAVQYVNESDEFEFEIDAVYEDTQTDPSVGRQKAQKVVEQDGAQYIAGEANSSVALALAEYANNQNVVYTSGGAAMALTGENCNEYTFRNETNTYAHAAGLVDFAAAEFGSKWWLHTANYAYGNSAFTQIENRIDAEGHDVDIVGRTKPQLGTEDFGPQISQIKNSDAEVLAIPLTGGDLINFMKQAQSAGLKESVEIIGTALFSQVIRGALGAAAAGTYSSTLYNHKLDTGDNSQFVDAYQSEYDRPPGSFARVGYEAVRMAARGIQAAGTADTTGVANTLEGLEMTTVLGDTAFRACDHQSTNPVWTGEITQSGDGTEVELLDKIEGENAVPPCDRTGCSM
jgi:branched-chain amino acid transport system substrate-binding protein